MLWLMVSNDFDRSMNTDNVRFLCDFVIFTSYLIKEMYYWVYCGVFGPKAILMCIDQFVLL